ncbi:asparagine synthase C-terminal domain-containing protein [Chloroflexota bacterium]
MPVFRTIESPAFDYGTIVQALEESVKRNLTDGLLLSGGLDTAIIAHLVTKWTKPVCITVALRGAPAPDIDYAKLVASRLKLRHYVHYFGNEELDESIRAVIRIMQSFDPMEIRNDASAYVALKLAKSMGLSTVMTGDGGDELFAGYSFLFELTREQLDIALKNLWASMRFSSIYLGKDLGLEVKLPLLDPQFKDFAMGLDVGLKVNKENGQVWGKWVLRKAFKNIVPQELLWRVKAPIEVGTGTTILPSFFDSRISNLEFSEKKMRYLKEDRVVVRDKEHLSYYEIYRSVFGAPFAMDSSAKSCPGCCVNVEEGVSFCKTCGAYPI